MMVLYSDYLDEGEHEHMSKEVVERQSQEFCEAWQGIDSIYEDYARRMNISYTTLYILNLISQLDDCTQKDICERGRLPKQTVNSVVTSLYKQGLVELRETPEDRRVKTVHLTDKGRDYTGRILPHVQQAEYEAMAGLTQEERNGLLLGMQRYCELFREKMLE